MSWGKQVHCDLVRQQDNSDDDYAATNNNILVDMNGTNGNCSCHKQSHCNRLTCYRSQTRSGSITQLGVLPLFITMLVLTLAMPTINAAVMKRSLAETTTAITPTVNDTNAHISPAGVGEIDFTTVNHTQLLANKQTIKNLNESVQSEHTAVPTEMSVVPEITTGSSTLPTVSTTTVDLSISTSFSDVSQNVNNDIPKIVSEESEEPRNIKQIFIESKFDNADNVLVGDLGNTVSEPFRNEIEVESETDVVAADVDLLQVVSDQAEDILTQTAHHEGSTKLDEKAEQAIDVLTEVTSHISFTEPHQSVSETTEKSTIAQVLPSNSDQSLTASKDLSIFFPLRDEELSSTTAKSIAGTERDARNFNINDYGNVDMLNDRIESNSQSMGDTEMQNIEEGKNAIKGESLSADKSVIEPKLNHNSEATLHSHETNELEEEKPKTLDLSKIYENIITRPDEEMQYDESMIILDDDENVEDEEGRESVTTQLINAGNTDIKFPTEIFNATESTPVVSDEASLSIALNENLTASEPISVVVDDQPVDLLKLIESDPLLTEDIGTTVEPESIKNTHVVIKKQGVELDEALMALTPVEDVGETTTGKVLVNKTPDEEVETTERTLVTLENDLSITKGQSIQSDDASKVITPDLEIVSEAHGTNEEQDIEYTKESNNEEDKLKSDIVHTDTINNEQREPEELGEQAEQTTENEINNSASNELNTHFEGKVDALNGDQQYFIQTNNDIGNQAEKSTTTIRTIEEEEVIVQDKVANDLIALQSSTPGKLNKKEEGESIAKNLQQIENNFTNEENEKTSQSTSEEIEISKKESDEEMKATQISIETKVIADVETEDNFNQEEAEEKTLESTTEVTIPEKDEEHKSASQSSTATEHTNAQIHISLFSTTLIPSREFQQTPSSTTAATETHTTVPKEDANNNTDDADIVPLLVGVSTGQGDVTASTKGSRSINTQTHHSMLLTQMDDEMAATLFETFPPHNVGRTMNDHLAAESNGGGIGKVTSTSMLSRSGVIITVCTSIACMFLLASVVAFLISFQRQHGTLDIEMQEQRCGKDNLEEEDDEVGTCTKLLEIELPKPTIVSASSEELEECL